ncbi:leucine-rich repeat receptor-like serine/threonine-protein kinase BAM3 [Carica papaya]|uniref:leucine-rich repeat receptor-like serine/threonine-protein kinase BAM3 n=1 Tax=Carica papaya TaxID=3649 RepID=UPI000B8CD469|nr:leucine-rich repeat receptor-like serine/threonine-protein kinase BAM3 [Carica papaya]
MAASHINFLFLSSLFLLLLSSSSSSSHSVNVLSLRKQASILVSLKQGFESYYPSLQTWDASNYLLLCSWTGIQCDHMNTSVIGVDISNYNISGSLSPVITQLQSLVNLSVSGNSFSGQFPTDIHKLTRLQFLNISNNMFSGEFNWEFSRMKKLEVLDAYDNYFNGSLPLGVTDLPNLRYLSFGGNYLSGKIPPSYGKFRQLKYLSLAGNDLGGSIPRELGNLTSLEQLYLGYYNDFNGGIPAEFGRLINLVHLDLANCSLQGSIPPELGNLKKLDTLFLQTNELSGLIPPELGNMTSLKSLDLSNNKLTGEIPLQFSALQELLLLNLFVNSFHGEIPSFISQLPKLEVLKLWRNNFTGSIPSDLGRNGRLMELDLSSNKLTGLLPSSLCFGRRLKILILFNNFLFGPLPRDLGKCYTLTRVRMGQNYMTGSIPDGFLYFPNLSLVELQTNYLNGQIPSQTTKEPSTLAQLNLSNNRLSGSLPASIGNLSSLQTLLLTANSFTGEIPSEIGQLKSLNKLDMSMNNFSGRIPPEMGNCLQLTYLDLSRNQLSGPLPVQISQIHILNYLNVSWNNLNQSLPREIGSMKSLTSADFSHNNFSGSIPEFGQYSFFNSTSFVGNPQLCGSQSNPCNSSSTSPLQLHNQNTTKSSQISAKFKLLFALGLLFCSLVFALLAIFKTRKVGRNSNSWKITAFQKLEFGSQDILECIKENNIIGKGGAGIVYRGVMPNGEQVAVKKLLGINKGCSHDNGLSAEIQTLGSIRHRNIVRLLAFCSNKEMNLLVYEYMPNGSLGEVLHRKSGGNLKWEIRLKIAIEAAKGLCYLHHDCSPLILHRDVKSNNILLNSDFEAHVADFGLAKFLQDTGTSQCMSAIAGSYGYIAPEYAYTLKVDEKSDVYSFGVVLLELITGKRPVGDFGEEGIDIVQWSRVKSNCSKQGVVNILDQRLISNSVMVKEAMQVFFVAMLCVQEQSVERPTMREVVQMLAQAKHPSTFHMQ